MYIKAKETLDELFKTNTSRGVDKAYFVSKIIEKADTYAIANGLVKTNK